MHSLSKPLKSSLNDLKTSVNQHRINLATSNDNVNVNVNAIQNERMNMNTNTNHNKVSNKSLNINLSGINNQNISNLPNSLDQRQNQGQNNQINMQQKNNSHYATSPTKNLRNKTLN